MYTYQQRLEYARKLKRLHELYVIKDNIHLTYKYKNQNKAIHNAHSLQDKIINSIIDDAVYGNANAIKNIDSTIEKLMTSTLKNERKRIHHQNDKYVNRAVELNSERYTKILTNRINTEAIKLERKIESELRSGVHNGLSEAQKRKALHEKYQDTAKARIRNIIRDSVHTNESNISFINALNEGYNYKVWMNGRSKGKTRQWHRAKLITPVPIEDYFDIYGPYGHKESMYPGDLYSGAENVANCRCWLRYTNRRPEGLSKTPKTYNIPNTSYLSPQNKPSLTGNIISTLTKPIKTIKTTIATTTKKITSKIKQIGKKITTKIKTQKTKSKRQLTNFRKLIPKSKLSLSEKIHNEQSVDNAKKHSKKINLSGLIIKYPEIPKLISLATYHNKYVDNVNEYLTVLTKDGRLIADVFKGVKGETRFPQSVLDEPTKNILFTLHNHRFGAIVPSGDDIHNVIIPNIQFTGIVSGKNFGLIINNNKQISKSKIEAIERDFNDFNEYVTFCFDLDCAKELSKLKKSTSSKKEYKHKEEILFDKYVSKNNSKFIGEFNSRMTKYNIELIHIKL